MFLRFVVIFFSYYYGAKLGLSMEPNNVASLIWPPSGIALAAILIWGNRIWPAIYIAAFLTNYSVGAHPITAAIIAIGNTLEPVIGAYFLRKFNFHSSFDRIKDLPIFVISACTLGVIISPIIGVTSLWASNVVKEENFFLTWKAWSMGDALGILLVTPLLLEISNFQFRKIKITFFKAVEIALFIFCFASVCFMVFGDRSTLPFWFFPIIVWASLRFGQLGNLLTLFLLSSVSIYATTHGKGPFSRESFRDDLYIMHYYLAVISLTGITLAASLSERKLAENAKDDFISIASHELKTPLTTLILRTQLAMTRTNIDADFKKFLEICQGQVGRLMFLVEELLDVNRIQRGKFSFAFKNINLSDAVKKTVTLFSDQMTAAKCPLEMSIQENIFGFLDLERIEQLIENLLSNITKYAPQKPSKILLTATEKQAELIIEDQGPGIPLDKQSKVFDRYECGSPSGYTAGLGLGLYIVKEIVTAHHGSIVLQSNGKNGSKFIIKLPLNQERTA